MDYKNGKIYKIVDNAYTKMYIGSTTQPLTKRFSKHKQCYKVWKNGKASKVSSYCIFDEFGIENCKIELIEEYACENKNQLERKEGEHIRNNDCVNKLVAGRTQKEYVIDNKDKINEKNRQYYEKHKEKLQEINKQYYEEHKEKLQEMHKQYNEDNKEKIQNYKKQYYEDKKEKLQERINCECGGKYTKIHKLTHNKTKKHLTYEETKKN
jgi:hypothetical protein